MLNIMAEVVMLQPMPNMLKKRIRIKGMEGLGVWLQKTGTTPGMQRT